MGSNGTMRALAVLAAVALVGNAAAQAQSGAEPASPAPDVELGARRDVTLTVPQMVAEAKAYLPEMDRAAAVVRRMLAEAREQRDVVRVLCLNDKLNQIDLAIRTANDRMEALNAAAGQNDQDQTKHEFTVIQVLRDRVRTLVTEANQCIGEETGFIGDQQVTFEIDPNIPETDPSEFPDEPFVSEPPVLTSPTF